MKRVPDISAAENFRLVPIAGWPGASSIKRDPVEPVPVGTLIAKVFRVAGYDPDCDGSIMARLENVDEEGRETGWDPEHLGLSPNDTLVVEDSAELFRHADGAEALRAGSGDIELLERRARSGALAAEMAVDPRIAVELIALLSTAMRDALGWQKRAEFAAEQYRRRNKEAQAAEAIVRDRTVCGDHAGNYCSSWCQRCRDGAAWELRASGLRTGVAYMQTSGPVASGAVVVAMDARRAEQLTGIVRDLAATDPHDVGEPCFSCGVLPGEEHTHDCVHRRAVEAKP